MADRILHKRSGKPGAAPLASQLAAGELALNTADGRAFMKRDDGEVVRVGGAESLPSYTSSGLLLRIPLTTAGAVAVGRSGGGNLNVQVIHG